MPRLLAILLALAGCFWSLLLAPWFFRPTVSPVAVLLFGPGYLVTLGYIIRSVSTPALTTRRLIWVVSLVVQGGWLAWIALSMFIGVVTGHSLNEPVLVVSWWVFATAASVVGFLAEKPKKEKGRLSGALSDEE